MFDVCLTYGYRRYGEAIRHFFVLRVHIVMWANWFVLLHLTYLRIYA